MSEATGQVTAGWHADPFGRNELRYWDGKAWTEHVSTGGAQKTDPPVAMPVPPPVSPALPPPPPVQAGPSQRTKKRAVLVLIGGVLMAIGAPMPWETASGFVSLSVAGTSEGSGSLVLVCGVIIAILAGLVLTGNLKRRAGIAALALSALGTLLAFINVSSVSDDVDAAKALGVDAAIGIGLIITVIGCLLAVVSSILLLRAKDTP